jgi:urea transport system permease protein
MAVFAAFHLVLCRRCTCWCRRDSALHVSAYAITLIGKIMCYAIVAVAMDLIWGYGGILSLGHGLFFALGGYAFGMYLMRQIGRDGSYQSDLPDFMVFLDWKELPWYWAGSDSFLWALFLVLACRRWWPSCSATSPSARASRACISRSSPRR